MRLLRYPWWLLGCCYAVARVTRVVATVLLRCCYAIARVLRVVARLVWMKQYYNKQEDTVRYRVQSLIGEF